MSNIIFVILSTLFVSNVCVSEGLCVPCLVAYKRSFPYTALLCALFAFVLIPAGVGCYFFYNNVLPAQREDKTTVILNPFKHKPAPK